LPTNWDNLKHHVLECKHDLKNLLGDLVMAFKPVTERSFDLPPSGGQLGVITALVELGTQRQRRFGDSAEAVADGEEFVDVQSAAIVI
jgi:hypothetical protein